MQHLIIPHRNLMRWVLWFCSFYSQGNRSQRYSLFNFSGLVKGSGRFPGWVAQSVEALSHAPKGCSFDPWSGLISRLWVGSLVRVHTGGNRSMSLSHINVSLSLSLCSPPPSSFSNINEHIPGWGFKKRQWGDLNPASLVPEITI